MTKTRNSAPKKYAKQEIVFAYVCLVLWIGLTILVGPLGFLFGLIMVYFQFKGKGEEESLVNGQQVANKTRGRAKKRLSAEKTTSSRTDL
jgi:hypothetical protein